MTGREKFDSLSENLQNEIFAMMRDEVSDQIDDFTHLLLDIDHWSAEDIDAMLGPDSRIRQNGVVMPRAHSVCGRTWQLFDRISKRNKTFAKVQEAVVDGKAEGISPATIRTQYNLWRKFHGIEPQGRVPRMRQNGILKPLPDSKCGRAWAIFAEVSMEKGSPASLTECYPIAHKRGLNIANVKSEYRRWRKFWNIPSQDRAPRL